MLLMIKASFISDNLNTILSKQFEVKLKKSKAHSDVAAERTNCNI